MSVREKPQDQQPLSDLPVTAIKGVGPQRAAMLGNLDIRTVEDLLKHFPRSYHDRTNVSRIADLKAGDSTTIRAEVVSTKITYLRRRMCLAQASIKDDSGTVSAAWFNQPYMTRVMKPGLTAFFTGEVIKYGGLQMRNPEYEFVPEDDQDTIHTGRIVPVYRVTEGISQRQLRSILWDTVQKYADQLDETLPASVRDKHSFPPAHVAIRNVHFPENMRDPEIARRRFVFEELLHLQLRILSDKSRAEQEVNLFRMEVDGPRLKKLKKTLPFELTKAQHRAVDRILSNLSSETVMNRLLQGDVGCGKTVVALHAIAAALDSGCQTAFMAPTEILAEQHYISLKRMLAPLGVEPALLIGGMKSRDANAVRRGLKSGDIQIVVGTHALIQESVSFAHLGLVIVDEQHRFGVLQRATLKEKGLNPHLLLMTATPIPRTLALTLYGAMDISVIDELPPGRKPVKTNHVPRSKERQMHDSLRKEVEKGKQVFLIYPLIEESKKLDVEALLSAHEQHAETTFKDLETDFIHGRMKTEDKEDIMRRFNAGEIDILFSTTVVEVGIDVPNATVMVINDAHRFGLAQLHQLRGRVGRGEDSAYCFLTGKPRTADAKKRIEVMQKTCDGFVIAEEDMKIRGPGEIQGIRQSGMSDLKIADLVRDMRLLELAREEAERLLKSGESLTPNIQTHIINA
jgi:ATP-dependent DNA helicase RecG